MLRPGQPIAQNMYARGIAVQSAAKRRLAYGPRRIDTGRLRNSIQMVEMQRDGVPVIRVGSGVHYAAYVHQGTRRMRPNPYLRDALKAAVIR